MISAGGRCPSLKILRGISWCNLWKRRRKDRKSGSQPLILSRMLISKVSLRRQVVRRRALIHTSMIYSRVRTRDQQLTWMVTSCTLIRNLKRSWPRTKAVKWEQTRSKVPRTIFARLLRCSNILSNEWIKSCSGILSSSHVSIPFQNFDI